MDCAADIDTGPCRPNIVGPVQIYGNRDNYFSSSMTPLTIGAVAINNGAISYTPGETSGPWQRPAPGTFGNAGYNSLRGPGFFDTDVAVLKTFSLTESSTLQFRTDIANVFNRVNLGLPSGCVDCGLAAITQLANGAVMRQIEFALKLSF
jgi:hypothetical protein